MWTWHVAYEGDQHAEESETQPHDYKAMRERFRVANAGANSFKMNGRAVAGMWVIDPGTEQADVILIFGRVPHDIRTRYNAHLQQLTSKK